MKNYQIGGWEWIYCKKKMLSFRLKTHSQLFKMKVRTFEYIYICLVSHCVTI